MGWFPVSMLWYGMRQPRYHRRTCRASPCLAGVECGWSAATSTALTVRCVAYRSMTRVAKFGVRQPCCRADSAQSHGSPRCASPCLAGVECGWSAATSTALTVRCVAYRSVACVAAFGVRQPCCRADSAQRHAVIRSARTCLAAYGRADITRRYADTCNASLRTEYGVRQPCCRADNAQRHAVIRSARTCLAAYGRADITRRYADTCNASLCTEYGVRQPRYHRRTCRASPCLTGMACGSSSCTIIS